VYYYIDRREVYKNNKIKNKIMLCQEKRKILSKIERQYCDFEFFEVVFKDYSILNKLFILKLNHKLEIIDNKLYIDKIPYLKIYFNKLTLNNQEIRYINNIIKQQDNDMFIVRQRFFVYKSIKNIKKVLKYMDDKYKILLNIKYMNK
jgi:hypothetical protein